MNVEQPKKCPACGKPLRADNRRGACSDCINAGKASPDPSFAPKEAPATVGSSATVRKQFRTLATTMGFDPERVLLNFMRDWLNDAKAAVRKTFSDDLRGDD